MAHCGYADFIFTAIMIGRPVLMRGWKVAVSPFQEWFVEIGKVVVYEEMDKYCILINGKPYIIHMAVGGWCDSVIATHFCVFPFWR